MNVLFTTPSGSRLYGTDGPNSDYDYKSVFLPSLDSLLLNKRQQNVKQKPEGKKAGDKMLAGETEQEFLPFHVFVDDFYGGQTYAVETAFAVLQGKYTPADDQPGHQDPRVWVEELVQNFLTSNVKAMVGYAVGQSKLYGMKTERYASMKEAARLLKNYHFQNDKLQDTGPAFLAALSELPYVKFCKIMNGAGGQEPADALDIVGKQFPLTNRVQTVLQSLEKSLEHYGSRVKQFEGLGVDWKALSHAARITNQALQLLRTGQMTFPVPNAEYLRDVKEGRVDFDEATDYLAGQFDQLDHAVENSVLQPRTHERDKQLEAWKLAKLKYFYGLEH